jgi:hypothetical protein
MKFHDFAKLISDEQSPTILVEGRRTIPADAAATVGRLASHLARRFPNLLFRSGNASGSDEAFAAGVFAVAPERMQIIAPYAGHRRKQRYPLAHYDSPESLSPDAMEAVQAMTVAATPANKGLMKWYQRGGKLGSQAACLIRDTMKVAGVSGQLAKPVAALFFVDPADPEAGGTGHTIRVCRNAGVPVYFQQHWATWLQGS